MAIGYLQIQTRTAREAIPLDGALVQVLDDEGNVLYRLITNESGETTVVPLETTDGNFSRNPDYLGAPYFSYGVKVEAEGFEPVTVERIPIFDGETAVLPVSMVPLPEEQNQEEAAGEQPGRGFRAGTESTGHVGGRAGASSGGDPGPDHGTSGSAG